MTWTPLCTLLAGLLLLTAAVLVLVWRCCISNRDEAAKLRRHNQQLHHHLAAYREQVDVLTGQAALADEVEQWLRGGAR